MNLMNLPIPATDLLATFTPTLAQTQSDTSTLIEAMGDNFPVVMVFGVGGLIAIISIFLGTLRSVAQTKETEQTKRELAAYVAEGSMTPADAERILRSNKGKA